MDLKVQHEFRILKVWFRLSHSTVLAKHMTDFLVILLLLCACDVCRQHAETHDSGLHQSRPGSGAGRHSAASRGCSGGVGGTGTDPECNGQGRAREEVPGWVLEAASPSHWLLSQKYTMLPWGFVSVLLVWCRYSSFLFKPTVYFIHSR